MGRWRQGGIMGIVVLAHVALAVWLSYAMVPPAPPQRLVTETVMIMELIDLSPLPEPESETRPDQQPPPVAPEVRPPAPARRQAVPMQAIIEPSEASPSDPEPAREFVAPERDPFHRPSSPAARRGFGRSDLPALPEPNRPRLAGERPPDAPLPEIRMPHRDARMVLEAIGSFIGGGPGAPAEAPCGGRMSGGFGTADSFSPNWQRDHGCGDTKEAAGFDGTVELPPGVAGERDR